MSNELSIEQAARALVTRLHAVHDDSKYQSVWALAQLHDGPYEGPQYVQELEQLEAALAQTLPPVAPASGLDLEAQEAIEHAHEWVRDARRWVADERAQERVQVNDAQLMETLADIIDALLLRQAELQMRETDLLSQQITELATLKAGPQEGEGEQ